MKICLIIPSYFPAIEYGGPIYAVRSFVKFLSINCEVNVHTTTVRQNPKLILSDYEIIDEGVSVRYFDHKFFVKNTIEMYGNIRAAELVCINSIFSFFCIFSLLLAFICRKKIVLQPRGSLSQFGLSRRRYLKIFFLKIYRIFLRKEDIILVTSSAEALEAKIFFNSKCRICILPNGFEEPVSPRSEPSVALKQSVKNIAFVGRFHKKKRIDLLIKSISVLKCEWPDVYFMLTLYGFDDGNINEIQKLVNRLGLWSNVNFKFGLTRDEIIQELSTFDCLALVSENENFGNVILESLYAGTPVVFSKSLPWNNLEKLGLGLGTDAYPTDIAKTIYEACNLKGYAEKHARSHVLRNFGWEIVTTNFLEVVNDISHHSDV